MTAFRRRTARVLAIAGVVGAGLVGFGCASGLALEDLPTDPIALTYWEPEPARRRAEIIKQREAPASGLKGPKRVGVARVGDLGRMMGGASEEVWNRDLRRFPGRLSLFHPATGEIESIPEIPLGAVALAWSEDRKRLLYLSNHRERVQLYEYQLEKREVRQVTSGPEQHLWGDYGLDRQIAVLRVGLNGGEVFAEIIVTDTDGRSPRVVLDEGQIENMRLTADGKTLIYVHHPQRDHPELVALDLATGKGRPLGPGHEPSLARTGDWIVYSARSRDGWRLRRVRRDGSARASMGEGIRDEMMPTISPDGRFVAYIGKSLEVDRLFVQRIDGSGDRILLNEGGSFSPVW